MENYVRRKATYGKKTRSASEATSSINLTEFMLKEKPMADTPIRTNMKPVPKAMRQYRSTKCSRREVLEDVTELFGNITIAELEQGPKTSHSNTSPESLSTRAKSCRASRTSIVDDLAGTLSVVGVEELSPITNSNLHARCIKHAKQKSSRRRSKLTNEEDQVSLETRRIDIRYSWLQPLIDVYRPSGNPDHGLSIQSWHNLIDPKWPLSKIAESSYAEVYKVSNKHGTSILKIMSLKPPKGPGSQRETSIPVETVLSEVIIMNTMADLNGFVEFKEAHIIEGRPPVALQRAFDSFSMEHETFFPKPNTYHPGQLFVVLELGDAGTDVEHFKFTTTAQIWDLFLGVVTALASGEQAFAFEHRDLHEGNVCLKQIAPAKTLPKTNRHRQGYSGLEITLLDYTLSRASTLGRTLYLDLESDPEIFASTSLLQHQMYRRMRNWIFFRTHGIHPLFDSLNPPPSGSWADFEPFTNVIWLWYILTHVLERYRGKGKGEFLRETEELRAFLHPDVRIYDGGFSDVRAVYEYCVEKGWILV